MPYTHRLSYETRFRTIISVRVWPPLDYFLISQPCIQLPFSTEILPISWSDHAPITLSIDLTELPPKKTHWRLNETLLHNPEIFKQIETNLKDYFKENEGTVSSLPTLWEAHKATIRGHLISVASHLKKKRHEGHLATQKRLQSLEKLYNTLKTESVLTQIITLRKELASYKNKDAEKDIIWTKLNFYEKGDKQHTLLAKKLRDQKMQTRITSLTTPTGHLTHDPDQIASQFQTYYKKLYNLRPNTPTENQDLELITQFLNKLPLQKFSENDLETLNKVITGEELAHALKNMANGKTPGPDGLTYKYYKMYAHILSPYLLRLYNEYLSGTPIPASNLTSFLSLIPKAGKDNTQCSNYRPIALLNSDLKLFSKILANRLAPLLTKMIHKDQVGFILGCQAGDNTRRTIDLIEIINRKSLPSLLLSLDAEKAFDRLQWPYLFTLLKHLNLSGPFLTALYSLYNNPRTSLKLPSKTQNSISVTNGTRQGCPLSPLLYALSIEPLAAAIRCDPNITGITINSMQFKIALFADDVLLTLTNPIISLPNLHTLLENYGLISGYKINLSKTEALPLHIPDLSALKQTFNYNWKTDALSYLGTQITADYQQLFDFNFKPLIHHTRATLLKWSTQSISWFGRIAAVKMSILPKFLYLFETLPVKIRPKTLNKIQKTIHKFIWSNCRHRIPQSVLMSPLQHGGLGVPVLKKYYEAAQLRQLLAWSHWTPQTTWGHIENDMAGDIHINSLIWTTNDNHKIPPTSLNSTRLTLQLWNKLQRQYNLKSTRPGITIYLKNPAFQPGTEPSFYNRWSKTDLFTVDDLIDPQTQAIYTFPKIKERAPTVKLLFFEYLQLLNFVTTHIKPATTTPRTAFETMAKRGLPQKSLISNIYKLLTQPLPDQPPNHSYMTKWNSVLQMPLPQSDWEAIWSNAKKMVTCARHKLHKLFPDCSPLCWRNCGAQGTLIHIFWECPLLQQLWTEIANMINHLLGFSVPKGISTFLLGKPFDKMHKCTQALLNQILTATRLAIASKWKSTVIPTIAEVKQKVNNNRLFESRISFIQNKTANYLRIWSIWELRGYVPHP
uniref:Reverse transcriptase domain-containing protein n=1 Tax=Xenopus tropicalis TaxID=8364 RepID=A0A803K2X3_XENTR